MAPAAAGAAEPTTNYKQTPPPSTTKTEPTTSYKQTPPPTSTKSETAPAKQEVGPKQEEATRSTSHEVAPATSRQTSTTRARASSLPFTGLDLRWVIFGGVLMLGSGLSILVAQRRRGGAGR
jgi:uncharacterized membrane protein